MITLCLPVPSVPVDLDIEIINSSAVVISWSTPFSTNGVILSYELCYSKRIDLQQAKVYIYMLTKESGHNRTIH